VPPNAQDQKDETKTDNYQGFVFPEHRNYDNARNQNCQHNWQRKFNKRVRKYAQNKRQAEIQ
jgi:hypothetical protein